ncbi:MAG: hypothetical protein JNK25_05910 [Phycisphaerae bacterium]|nr:hypothetical protein [Phycisphaerae bacterium]
MISRSRLCMSVLGLAFAVSCTTAQNIALNKPVSAVGGSVNGASPSSITDGEFRPRGTQWQDGTVWWNGLAPSLEIDLQETYTITGLIVQADDNDSYQIQFRRPSDGSWLAVWTLPIASGGGMQTRPNPANDTQVFQLAAPVDADKIRVLAISGDNSFSVSEVQAFGAPRAQCAAEWRLAQIGARANSAAAFDTVRGHAVLFGGILAGSPNPLRDTWLRFPSAEAWTAEDVLAPPARSRHAMAFDEARQRLVLFGGQGSSSSMNDTWEWDGDVWIRLTPSESPPVRYGHTMAYDAARQRVVLFGGFGGSGTPARLRDTWTWDGTAWTLASNIGPSARFDSAMAYSAFNERIILVGGNTGTTAAAEVWQWNGTTWTQLQTPTTAGWTSRSGHAMAYDSARGRLVLFGGVSGSTYLSDLWEWAGAAWTRFETAGPAARSGLAMYFDPANLRTVVYGGVGASYFGDTWEWSGTAWTPRVETLPSARTLAAMAEFGTTGRLLLFGGSTAAGTSNETWEWMSGRWSQRVVTGPAARIGHKMAYDVQRGRIVLFGGSVSGGVVRDTHEWTGSQWIARNLSAADSPPSRQRHGMAYDALHQRTVLFGGTGVGLTADTWSFDGTRWTILVPAGTGRPTVRVGPAMAFDPLRGQIVMFGGRSTTNTALDETWILENLTWRLAVPSARPSARSDAAIAFDGTRGTAVLSGGFGPSSNTTDTWEWDGTTWFSPSIASPTARQAAAMAYDSAARRMTIFGGNTGTSQVVYVGDTWVRNSTSLDAPTFTTHPQSIGAATNEPIEFSVIASNALTYRWRRNGVFISDGAAPGGGTFSGTATPTLRLSVVTIADAGTYDAVATNTCGATVSNPAVMTIEHGPDLIVTGVEADPPDGLNGDPVTLRWMVQNIGDRTAPAGFANRVFVTQVSPPGTEQTVSGLLNVTSPLAPGQSAPFSFNATFPNPAGSMATYRYTVRTDNRTPQNVHEMREDNNAAASPDVSVVVPPPADLTPTNLSAPETVLFGSPFTISWSDLNQGGIIRRSWNSRVVLSQNEVFGDADDVVLSTPASGTSRLPSGQSAPFSVSPTVAYTAGSVEGVYYLIVRSDSGGVLVESDETNNTALRPVELRFPMRPDLVVSSSTAPLEGLTEQSFQISWTVTNGGNAAANGWTDRAYLSTNPTYESTDPPLGPALSAPHALAPGESYQRTQQYLYPVEPGTYYIIIRTDVGGSVVESPLGEQNNTRVHTPPVLVRQFPKPDLQITSVTPVSSGVISGQTITVRFQVSNMGTGPTSSPSWRDAIFLLSPDQQFGTSCLTAFTFLGESVNPSYLPAPGNNDNRYEQIVQVALPHDITGTFKIGIITDARRTGCPGWALGRPGDVSELIESNNAAYTPTFTIELEPQPDLQVQNIALVGQPIVFSGQSISIDRTIINRGGDPPRGGPTDVGSWTDRIFISPHDRAESPNTGAGDIVLGDVGSGSGVLQPGQTYSARTSHTLPANLSGIYYVKCQTDITGRVTEFGFEGNNIGVSTAPIDVRLTPPPDLEPTAASFTGPLIVVPQQVVSFAWSVENFGAPPLSNISWSDGAYLSADSVLNTNNDPLMARPGASSSRDEQNQPIIHPYSRSGEYRLPGTIAAGEYRLIVRTDDQGNVFEGTAGEANNIRVSQNLIRVEARYANLVAAIDGVPTPSGYAGARGTLGWRVTNSGVVPTQVNSWVDRVWLHTAPSPGGTVLSTHSRSTPLSVDAGYVHSIEFTVPLVGPGQYYLVIATDADNNVAEGPGEGNNIIAIPFTVTAEAADLAVVSLSAPESGDADQQISVSWEVENRGVLPTNANSWIDRVYLSRNPNLTGAIEIGARTRTQPLAPSQAYQAQGNYTLPRTASGLYYVLVRTDTNSAVFESNEANNTGPQPPPTINVTPLDVDPPTYPNLEAVGVTAPPSATESQPMQVSWTVANTGQASISAPRTWRDSLYLSRDQFFDPPQSGGLGDVYIGTFTQRGPVAGGGGVYEATATPVLPAGVAGPYFLIVRADAGGDIDEGGRESDNTSTATNLTLIDIAPLSDLTVASVTPPASAELGAAAPFAWSIRNSGESTIRATWQDSLFLSTDPVWSIDDRRIGNFQTNPGSSPLAPGDTVGGSATPRVPGVTPGEYYVVARTDVLNQVPETDEGNNAGVSATLVTVDASTLLMGIPQQVPLSSGQDRYFKFTGVEGRTVRLHAQHTQPATWLELYVRRGQVPTTGQFDYAYEIPARSSQEIIIPRGESGDYYSLVRATSGATGVGNVIMSLDEVPFSVAQVTPSVAGNAGTVTLTIRGAQFDELTTVRIADPATGRELEPLWQRRDSASRLLATFSLIGESPGLRDIMLRSEQVEWRVAPTGHIFDELVVYGEDRAVGVFEIVPGGGPQVRVSSQLPPSARLGAVFPIIVTVENLGLNDAQAPFVQIGSPNGAPLSFSSVVASASGSQLQALICGSARADVLGPGEAVVLTVYCRAITLPASQITAQLLESTERPVDWEQLERYYRDSSPLEQWSQTWAAFRDRVGVTWADVHSALRERAGRRWTEVERYFNAKDLMLDLLAVARSEGMRVGINWQSPSSRYGPRIDCDSYIPQDCEQFACRIPVICDAILEVTEVEARILRHEVTRRYGPEASSVILDYMDSDCRNRHPGRYFGPGDRPSDELATAPETMVAIRLLMERAAAALIEQGDCMTMECDTPVPYSLTSLFPNGESENLSISWCPSCTAGGMLVGGQSGSVFGPDLRRAVGDIVFTKRCDPCTGLPTSIEATPAFYIEVIDAFDFCPGGLGDWKARIMTVPLARLERNNYAFPVPLSLRIATDPNQTITVATSGRGASVCESPMCPLNPPANPCSPVCEEGCNQSNSSGGGSDCCESCGGSVPTQQAIDPNEKSGPSGFGAERWIPNASIPYRIYYENLPTATAPASLVTITDDLSPDLIPGSFRLGRIQIFDRTIEIPPNRISYSTTVDLRATRGVLLEIVAGVDASTSPPRAFWTLQSIDPATGLPPVTGDLGFLPPNDETGRGEGYVEFTIRPRTSVATGTLITNDATIIFDNNEQIRTNIVSNTIDAEAPVSAALPLPAASDPGEVIVNIAAGDMPGGSGLAGSRLFVSRDGGAYQPVSSLSFDQQAAAILEAGHVYRFVTQATDNAGNIESLPGTPDAITTTLSIGLSPSSDTGIPGDGLTNDRTPTLAFVGPPGTTIDVRLAGPREIEASVPCGPDGRGMFTVPDAQALPDGVYAVSITSGEVSAGATIAIDTTPPVIDRWQSIATHGEIGDITITIFSGQGIEPRGSGVARLRYIYEGGPPDSAIPTPDRVEVTGVDAEGRPINLTAISITTSPNLDLGGVNILFTPALPDRGRYCVRLVGVRDAAGNPLDGVDRLDITALAGDTTFDRRTNNTDAGAVQSLMGTNPIDPANAQHVRADLNTDGRIDAADRTFALTRRGADLRHVLSPCPSGRDGGDHSGPILGGGLSPLDPDAPPPGIRDRPRIRVLRASMSPEPGTQPIGTRHAQAAANVSEPVGESSSGDLGEGVAEAHSIFVLASDAEGVTVGYIKRAAGAAAALWSADTGVVDLSSMLAENEGWTLLRADAIAPGGSTQSRRLSGDGIHRGVPVRFELEVLLIDEASGDIDGDGVLGEGDLAALLGFLESGDPCCDVNGDGAINGQDVAALIQLIAER